MFIPICQDVSLLMSRDPTGAPPLLKAARLGNSKIVEHILGRAPQAVRSTDPDGRGPLHWTQACTDQDARITMTDLLQARGADKNMKDLVGFA